MILELENICKEYMQGKIPVPVLKNINFSMEEGEYVAIMGPSGSGKTTLMNIVGCLDQATSGRLILDGQDISKCSDNQMSDIRLQKIGFVFQNFQLLSRQSAMENVCLPLTYAGVPKKERRERAAIALERVGLGDRMDFKPTQLSGGQKQRVAMARMIASEPDILLLDEPFSALDSYLKWELEQEMRDMLAEVKKPVLFVSHNRDEVYRLCNMVSCIDHGKMEVIEETKEFFHNPKTKTAAVLSGCKNISAVEIVDNSHIKAVDWGITLCVPEIPKDTKAVGIRAHSFYPVDAEPVQDMNILRIEESRIIEDPFEWNISFRPSKESGWLQWKIAKTEQEDSPGPIPPALAVHAKDILLLKDNAYE